MPADRMWISPRHLPLGLILGGAALMSASGLVFDLLTTRGVQATAFFVATVFLGYWFPWPRAPLALALFATALTILGHVLSVPDATPLHVSWINRSLSVGSVWLAAVFVWRLRLVQRQLQQQVDIAVRLADENRLLAAIVEDSDDAILSKNLDGNIMSCNAGAVRLFGFAPEELIGKPITTLIPPDRLPEEDTIVAHIRQGEAVDRHETVRRCKDGSRVDVSLTVSPLRNAGGTIIGASIIARDITARKRTEDALRQSEERFRSSVIKSPVPTILFDDRETIIAISQSWLDAAGFPAHELKQMEDWTVRAFGDRSSEILKLIRQIIATQPEARQDEQTILTRSGYARIWNVVTSGLGPLSDGRRLYISVAVDVTDHKAYEERIELLMREARHRVKNVLTLVQAIARYSAAGNPEGFLDRFSARIAALAANQNLLVMNPSQEIELTDLVKAQLQHFADLTGRRIKIDGPRLHLNPAAAQALGLALHELATNAAKYGALSVADGRVDITWRRDGDSFAMSWIERGGPPVKPPKNRGFGTTVIEQMVRQTTSGEASLDFAPSGVAWRLTCPAANVQEETTAETQATAGAAAPRLAPPSAAPVPRYH